MEGQIDSPSSPPPIQEYQVRRSWRIVNRQWRKNNKKEEPFPVISSDIAVAATANFPNERDVKPKSKKVRKSEEVVNIPRNLDALFLSSFVASDSNLLTGRLREEMNPMMNPVVLSVLFEHCSPEQLSVFRLVSKLWHDCSLPWWRRRAPLTLVHKAPTKYNPKTLTLLQFICMVTRAHNSDTQNDPHKLLTHPFRNFIIQGWAFTDYLNKHETIPKFWKMCGNWIHELCIYDCTFSTNCGLEMLVFEHTPNLTKLTLLEQARVLFCNLHTNVELPMPEIKEQRNLKTLQVLKFHRACLLLDWDRFFRRYPCLEKLVFEFGSSIWTRIYCLLSRILTAAQNVRLADSRNLRVKYLDLFNLDQLAVTTFPEIIARTLHELAFPLETLKMDVGYKTPDSDIELILRSVAPTIKTLVLFRGPFRAPLKNFPFGITMNNLEHLELHGPLSGNLGFLQYFPNLKLLHIVRKGHESKILRRQMEGERIRKQRTEVVKAALRQFPEEMDQLTMPHLEEFRLDIPIRDPDSVRKLKDWMPNLRVLHVHIESRLFPVICDLWKETLQELRVFSDENTSDRLICGVETAANVRKRRSTGDKPNVTCLKELEVFQLHIWDERKKRCPHKIPKITNTTILHGLLYLPKLRLIDICMMKGKLDKLTFSLVASKKIQFQRKCFKSCGCGRTSSESEKKKKRMITQGPFKCKWDFI